MLQMKPRTESEKEGKADWVALPDEALPQPTYWPAVMAAGITAVLWGLVTSLIITAVGVGLMAISAAGWIVNVKHGGEND